MPWLSFAYLLCRGVTKVLTDAGANLEAVTTEVTFVGENKVEAGATPLMIAAVGGFE